MVLFKHTLNVPYESYNYLRFVVEHVAENGSVIVVLNTENGVMKTFYSLNIGGIYQWAENPNGYFPETTFTH